MADVPADVALVLSKIKLYNHHPVPNQLFADIFPIFRSPEATEAVISNLAKHIRTNHDLANISAIVCLEARGFFIGPLIAYKLGLPCIPIRKPGKLPPPVVQKNYEKDYGPDSFQVKIDAFEGIETNGKEVILVDDLLGKGGSMQAAKMLVEEMAMQTAEAVFIFDVDVADYKECAQQKLGELPTYAMITLTVNNIGTPVNVWDSPKQIAK